MENAKTKALVVFVLFFASFSVAQEAEALEARHAQVNANAEKALIAMNATIEFLQAKGKNPQGLIAARDKFAQKLAVLKDAAETGDEAGFNETLGEMRGIASNFTDDALEDAGVNAGELKSQVQDRLKQKKQALAELEEIALRKKMNATLRLYDKHLAKAKTLINSMKQRAVNTSSAEEALSEIESLRAQLEAAYAAGNKSLSIELKQQAMQGFAKLRDRAYNSVIAKSEEVLDRAQKAVVNLDNKGVNTSAVKEKLAAVAARIQTAKTACQAGNASECKEIMSAAREQFKETREEIKDRVAEAAPGFAKPKNDANESNENKSSGNATPSGVPKGKRSEGKKEGWQ